jgi:hypothetical protein
MVKTLANVIENPQFPFYLEGAKNLIKSRAAVVILRWVSL